MQARASLGLAVGEAAPRYHSLAALVTENGYRVLAPCHCSSCTAVPVRADFQRADGFIAQRFVPPLQCDLLQDRARVLEHGQDPARGRIVGGAPSCPGQLPRGVLMDAQTVIAVCELLLVVVALIDLVGRRDE